MMTGGIPYTEILRNIKPMGGLNGTGVSDTAAFQRIPHRVVVSAKGVGESGKRTLNQGTVPRLTDK